MDALGLKNKDVLPWITVLVGSAMITAIALVYFKVATGSFIPTVLPEIQADLLYYLTQAKEVLDGHPRLGNPYIIEHANGYFPGLLLPIWLIALPGILGVSINTLFVINAFVYSIVLSSVLFVICKKHIGTAPWIAAGIALLGLASLHNLMIRPAIMQTVFPAFALFTLTVFGVLENPQSRNRYIALALMTAFTFYLYPFLWMITFTVIGLLTLATLYQRNWSVLRRLILMGVAIVILCLPQILISIGLFTDPSAHELHFRVGLVETHLIHPWSILFAKYTFIIVGGLLLLRRHRKLRTPEVLLLLLASAVIIGTCSNLISGKEMNFDTHFWRIGMFVNIIAIAVFAKAIHGPKAQRIIASMCLVAVMIPTINRVAIRAGGFVYLTRPAAGRTYHKSIQEFDDVFHFFNKGAITNAVIMAPDTLSAYIPLYTKNYIFFVGPAKYHSISGDELLERFLIKNIDRVDAKYLTDNIIVYAGWKAERETFTANAFGGNMQPIDWMGGKEFIDATLARSAIIDNEYGKSLRQFQIDYIVIDILSAVNPRLPAESKSIYQTERFTIYKVL
jgi:hypothetical protein